MSNYLAFDLGASNGRAILGQFDGEKVVMKELHRFENNYVEMNGVFYWDLPYLYDNIKKGFLAFAKGGFGKLDAFGIDTWGVDFGLLDKNGQLLGLPRAYRMAVQEDVDAVKALIPGNVLYSRTGIDTKLSFNTIYQLYRRKREGDVALENAETMLLMPDLLGYFLTGKIGTEYTNATTTQLYSPVTKDWDYETIRELGLPEKIFTKIEPSGTVRGTLRKELAEELGVNEAPFVAIGSHDTASAVAAIPGSGNFAFCSSGTWSLFGVETDTADLSEKAYQIEFSHEGTVQGGFRPLRNIIGMWLIQDCRREWIKEGMELSWNEVASQAAASEPFRSIINTDDPTLFAGGEMIRKIRELCEKNGEPVPETVGQFARCIYESLALKYRYVLEGLSEMKGAKIEMLNIVGGGIQNRLLDQMAADSTGVTVVTGPIEGGAMGNILMQAAGLGEIADIDALRQVVRNSENVETWEPHHTAEWDAAYERMLRQL